MINWIKRLFRIESKKIIEEVKVAEYPYLAKIIEYYHKRLEEEKYSVSYHPRPVYELYLDEEIYILTMHEYIERHILLSSEDISRSFLYRGVRVINSGEIEREKRREYFDNPINFC